MRIGMFVDCDDQSINGVATSVMTLKQSLEKCGHEVFLMVPRGVSDGPSDSKVLRFSSTELSFQRSHRFAYPWPLGNFWKIKKLNLDVIHIHTPFSMGCIARVVAFALGLPVVLTHHTLWEEYAHYVPFRAKSVLKSFGIWLGRSFANASNYVIAPSQSVKERLLQQGVTAPIEVMPTGIDPVLFQAGDGHRVRSQYGIKQDEKVCLYIGRLAHEKSIDFLIRSFQLLEQKDPNVRLFVVGDGPARGDLESLARELQIESSLVFTGFVDRAKLKHFQAAADVFWFASVTETQGLVTIEAMAAGLPVVAVEATGSSDTVIHGKTGFLSPSSIADFVAFTEKLFGDSELRRTFGDAGKERAGAFLSSDMGHQTLRIYNCAILQVFGAPGLPSGLS